MIGKLTKQGKERVRRYYGKEHEHPLYVVCDQAFLARAGRLEGVKADAEDIFCEVACLLDFLNDYPEFLSDQKDMEKHFSYLKKKYREWENATVEDREIIADTAFRIVRCLMCHRWGLCYSEELFDLMGNALRNKSRQTDIGEFEEVLLDYSHELDEWINRGYDGHLSDEIEEVAAGKTKKQKPKSGRKAVDPKNITASFSYLPKESYRNQRLQAFCHCLKRVFIDEKVDDRVFVDIFSGTSTTQKVVWIRDIRELHYLIDKMEELELLTWDKKYGKWQMVCARFNIRIKKKEAIDDSMTNDSYVIETLTPEQFSKDSGVPDSHDELDRIIRIINPEYNITESIQEILDEIDSKDNHDEIEDYRDALANDLQISSRLP